MRPALSFALCLSTTLVLLACERTQPAAYPAVRYEAEPFPPPPARDGGVPPEVDAAPTPTTR